jgi:hypothetical protein
MEEESKLEKFSGNLATNVGATAIGLLGATITPLAAFIPMLVPTLASRRHSERLKRAIEDIEKILNEHQDKLRNISDDQYKIINESIAAAFYTIDERKLEYLKSVIKNATVNADVCDGYSDAISRVIRDISAEEVLFLFANSNYEGVTVTKQTTTNERLLVLKPGSESELVLSGLINLGLFYTKDTGWDSAIYSWSPIVGRILDLLRDT